MHKNLNDCLIQMSLLALVFLHPRFLSLNLFALMLDSYLIQLFLFLNPDAQEPPDVVIDYAVDLNLTLEFLFLWSFLFKRGQGT